MIKKILAVAAVSLGALQLASSAQAATAFIDGNIYWGAGTPTTAYSAYNDAANFSFDVNSPISGGGSTTSISNFKYYLNGSAVNTTVQNVEFFPAALHGLFDINFTDGNSLSLYSNNNSDVGSSGTIGPSNYYFASAGINDALPGTGIGGVAVAVSSVPLPAALPLLGSAVVGLGVIARRRKSVAAA